MNKGKQVDYISVSEAHFVNGAPVSGQPGEVQKAYAEQSKHISDIEPIYKDILSKGTRIFEAAGNDRKYATIYVSDRLAIDGVEGVGSLTRGKVAPDSCSRNSVFTQHYEKRDYRPRLTRDECGNIIGVNVTGLSGTDLPLTRKTKKIAAAFGGTSYAVPVRVAKVSLNDMMRGIL